jgi:four helix bundle protein
MPKQSLRPQAVSHRDLEVWQVAMDLAVRAYTVTRGFPNGERFGLTSQLRRAAISSPANIAEGRCRLGRAEYRHFVSIARESTGELDTELELAARLGFLNAADATVLRETMTSVGRMLTNLAKSLRD